MLNVNLSNKKISPKLVDKTRKEQIPLLNPNNLISHRIDKNLSSKINVRKLNK